ncbi:MAG: MFS transporter [Prevotellaceae bacterium]|nr:MFS transporter [Prevotellaceae bacterium]MCD8303704.1 MFS transporter [Prevotellaceae bacterium]
MERLWNANYVKIWSSNYMLNFAFMILSPLLPLYLSEHFGANKDQIGMVLAGYALTALIIRPFSGFIVDSFQRKTVLLICYAVFTVLFGGYMLAGSILMFGVVRTLHGAPMGATTVSSSTVAIDVLPSSRRAEGIGYYGLSNNLSTAIAPAIGLAIYHATGNFMILFGIAAATALVGLIINCTLHIKPNVEKKEKLHISLDRFFLVKAWKLTIAMILFAFPFGVMFTYVAIYGKEALGITTGSGVFFALLSTGLVLSRLIGARSLRKGNLVQNGLEGVCISMLGYLLFASMHNAIGYFGAPLLVGFGYGHLFPAIQMMFINLAPHSQRGTASSSMLIAWDLGLGLGYILGGVIIEHMGYFTTFWVAWAVIAVGGIYFASRVRSHYLANKLR